jgi:carboxyl-terminal processing protease
MRLYSVLAWFLLSLFIHTAAAEIPLVSEADLVPAKKHERTTGFITHIISSYHYKKKELDDELSAMILNRYLDNLDPNRNYFLAADINSFQQYSKILDDALKDKNLSPAFDIFKLYRKRVDERVSYAISLLDDEFSFDKHENFVFDRRDMPWPDSINELNDIWYKRVKNDILNLKLANKPENEYKSTLRKRYNRVRTSTFQLDANDIFQVFINSYTTSIEPHTAYFSPRASENFDISMRLSLEGIGAVLSSDNDYTVIQHVIPGGPADLSNQLHENDQIIGVGQGKTGEIIDVIGWRLDDVVELIRGPKDTVLRLEIIPKGIGPSGPHKVITLTRNKIKLEEQAAKSQIIDIPDHDKRIGVIDIPTFYIDFTAQSRGEKNYKSTTRDVRKLITDLKKENIDGLVVDLRGNGGGSLSEALELTGLFIEEGPIVQTRDSTGRVEINSDPDPSIDYTGPLAILVDRNSASASEIFAGAIQDYQRGIIIGEPTFGKGTVQNVVDLNRFVSNAKEDHGRLKTTIAQFYRISGGSNQFKGVVPDIIFPTAEDDTDYGERSFENALPWDKVKPAEFIKVSAPVDELPITVEKHKNRIKANKAFQLLMQEINLIKDANNRKVVSLLENERIKERDELLDTKRELQNEIRLAQGLEPIPEDADLNEIDSEELKDASEILLNESAFILTDLIDTAIARHHDFKAVQQDRSNTTIDNKL